MISLETAKKLKEAGLEWEPEEGDRFYCSGYEKHPECEAVSISIINRLNAYKLEYRGRWGCGISREEDHQRDLNDLMRNHFFAPRLDQMLAWIEEKGYLVSIGSEEILNKYTGKWEPTGKYICCCGCSQDDINADFKSSTWDEAVAQAVLWILEVEK